jgi:hypothetical protein
VAEVRREVAMSVGRRRTDFAKSALAHATEEYEMKQIHFSIEIYRLDGIDEEIQHTASLLGLGL